MNAPTPPTSGTVPEYRTSAKAAPRGVPRESQIFVNRNLRMRSVGAFGFDLDYTLAHYRLWEIDQLAYRLTQGKLVEKRGHPSAILDIPFDPEFVVRGLVIDRRRGNILKMDYHNYVARAYHGRRRLTSEQRKQIYRMRRIRTSSEAYVSVDTLFHLPEVYLYLALVDHYEDRGEKRDYRQLYADVREMIDEAHADGSLKREIQADPARFVSPDPRLGTFLHSLREAGRKVFLLTNSERFYTDTILSHLLEDGGGPSWRSYFDLVVVDARKPRFFLKRSNWTEIATDGEGAPIYSGGDVWKLEKSIGHAGDAILYWGDHTYGDILRSKKSVGWRTAMIVPELATEIAITRRIAPDLLQLDEAIEDRDRIAQEEHVALLRVQRLEAVLQGATGSAEEVRLEIARNLSRASDRLAELRARKVAQHDRVAELDERCNSAYNKYWGMLFRERNEITRFGHQIKDFACIYTSRVSNFLAYPMNTYFRAPMERLPHEL